MHPGIRTTEFWVTVATDVGLLAAALAGSLSPKWAAIAASVSTAAYGIARGLAKQGLAGSPVKAVVQVTPTTPPAAPVA